MIPYKVRLRKEGEYDPLHVILSVLFGGISIFPVLILMLAFVMWESVPLGPPIRTLLITLPPFLFAITMIEKKTENNLQ